MLLLSELMSLLPFLLSLKLALSSLLSLDGNAGPCVDRCLMRAGIALDHILQQLQTELQTQFDLWKSTPAKP